MYKYISTLHEGDIGHTKLLTMNIDKRYYTTIILEAYTFPLKYTQRILDELKTLEKTGIVIRSVCLWSIPIVIVLEKAQPGKQYQNAHL